MTKAFQPHPYQQDAMAHIYATRRCALWMPMGCAVLDMPWPHK